MIHQLNYENFYIIRYSSQIKISPYVDAVCDGAQLNSSSSRHLFHSICSLCIIVVLDSFTYTGKIGKFIPMERNSYLKIPFDSPGIISSMNGTRLQMASRLHFSASPLLQIKSSISLIQVVPKRKTEEITISSENMRKPREEEVF